MLIFSEQYECKVLLASHHLQVRDGVLLMCGFVRSGNHKVGTVYDPCSTGSLITTRMANRLGLRGKPAQIVLGKVGGTEESHYGYIYELPLTDLQGVTHRIIVAGMAEITSDQKPVDMSEVARKFNLNVKEIERPTEKIDLLIGMDQVELMPDKI